MIAEYLSWLIEIFECVNYTVVSLNLFSIFFEVNDRKELERIKERFFDVFLWHLHGVNLLSIFNLNDKKS